MSDLYSFILCMKTLFLRKQTGIVDLMSTSFVFFSLILQSFTVTPVTGGQQTTNQWCFQRKSTTVSYRPCGWHLLNAKVTPSEGFWMWGCVHSCQGTMGTRGLKPSHKTCTAVCCTSWFCQSLLLTPPSVMLSTSHCHHANYISCCLGTWHSLSLEKKKEGETSTRLLCKLTLINHQLN